MAIAFDAAMAIAAKDIDDPLTSPWAFTSHTVGSGANRFLVVSVVAFCVNGTSPITGVTFNGVSMTKVRSDIAAGMFYIEVSIWFLHNPASGAKTISISFVKEEVIQGGIFVGCASYTGVSQTSVADAVNGKTGTASGAQTFTVTTVADNCWVVTAGGNTIATMATTKTKRSTSDMSHDVLADTNAAQTPAGAKTVGYTVGTANNYGWAMSGASFAPVAEAADTYSGRGVGRGIGRGVFR
jgi:hypothetical protein